MSAGDDRDFPSHPKLTTALVADLIPVLESHGIDGPTDHDSYWRIVVAVHRLIIACEDGRELR